MHLDDSEFLPCVRHALLETTFHGIVHPLSTPEAHVHQFRGIKYASIQARFRQSRLFTSYPSITDCTKYGYGILSTRNIPQLTAISQANMPSVEKYQEHGGIAIPD